MGALSNLELGLALSQAKQRAQTEGVVLFVFPGPDGYVTSEWQPYEIAPWYLLWPGGRVEEHPRPRRNPLNNWT